MIAPQTATCCRQGCDAAWEVFRNWSQNASRIKLDIISALCLCRHCAGEVRSRRRVCGRGADRFYPHVRGAPGVEQSSPEPLHGTLCWPPGGHVHHPGSPAVGDEPEPGPYLRVGVVGPGMDRAVDLLPRAPPGHAPGGGTVCALARRTPGALLETTPSQHQALYFSLSL